MTTRSPKEPKALSLTIPVENFVAHVAIWVFPPTAREQIKNYSWIVAIPGGTFRGLAYYDRQFPGEEPEKYSVARYLAANGVGIIIIDNLGTGQSYLLDRDKNIVDGHHISRELIGVVYTEVIDQLRKRILAGGPQMGLRGPSPRISFIGMGHSLGAFLLTYLQGQRPSTFDGIVLLGWSNRTIDVAVEVSEQVAANAQEAVQQYLSTDGYLSAGVRTALLDFFYSPDIPLELKILDRSEATTIPAGLWQAVNHPGILASEAKQISVPILLGTGEYDIPNLRSEPDCYPGSKDISLFIVSGAHHCANFEEHRFDLYKVILCFARRIAEE